MHTRVIFMLIVLVTLALGASTLGSDAARELPPLAWEGDRRATQEIGGAGQNEPYIAAHPTNPNNAVAVAKDFRTGEHARNYIYTTTDGGATWLEQPYPRPDPPLPYDTDPVVFFRGDGRAYLLGTSYSDFQHGGIFTAWSDDGGITWGPAAVAVTPPEGHFDDKAWLAFDETGGPYNGYIYATWTRFGLAEIYAARSTDGGATWSAAVQISSGSYNSDNDGAQPVLLPDGSLLVLFLHSISEQAGTLVAVRSTDGGATFGPNVPLFNVVKPPYTLPGENWRHFTYHSLAHDPVRGWLTVIWPDYGQAQAEGINILMSRSTDQGAAWSAPQRLNDDPPGVRRDQWFPAISAAPDGRLTAVWLDRRDDPNNRLYHAYARTSLDGGLTWQPAQRISSAPSNPNINIPPGADGIGDYIGVASGRGVVWAAWVDVRNGNQDIYAARDLFTPQPTPTHTATATATGVPPTGTPIVPTATPPAPTSTPQPTPTPCSISFSDVPPDAYFYEPVRYLYCVGAVSGYDDGTFRPWNNTTRSQVVKIVVLAEGWELSNPAEPSFTDVPLSNAFYTYIETAVRHAIIGGYRCGEPEPCDPQARPYFRPYADVTRGQLTKIVVLAEDWAVYDPLDPTFADVPPGSAFYIYIETAVRHAIIGGYRCGEPEPCDPQARPYFRPSNPSTRGQIAKIVYNAVTAP